MSDKISFRQTFSTLERAIDIAQKRHSLISSNISNLDTPKYKPKDIDFKSALSESMESEYGINLIKTDSKHIGLEMDAAESVEHFEEEGEWNGYNWVDLDKEMTRLVENNLRYRAATETLLRKIATLKDVIREGGH